jgi:transcriptional regulator
MLIHPWDAAVGPEEWRSWLRAGRDFGQLVTGGGEWPVIVPTHFLLDGDEILVHLARPNPIWPSITGSGRVVLSVVDDYAFVPGYWRSEPDTPEDEGVPTSYYAAVQLRCLAQVVDDPREKAALLAKQLAHFQPEGRYAVPDPEGPHARLLPGIRGLRLTVVEALAKFKYDDPRPAGLRATIGQRLRERGGRLDVAAAEQQHRRSVARPQG